MNEFITLKLDCVNGKHKGVKAMAMQLPLVPKKINPLPAKKPEKPPEWFLLYMKKVIIANIYNYLYIRKPIF